MQMLTQFFYFSQFLLQTHIFASRGQNRLLLNSLSKRNIFIFVHTRLRPSASFSSWLAGDEFFYIDQYLFKGSTNTFTFGDGDGSLTTIHIRWDHTLIKTSFSNESNIMAIVDCRLLISPYTLLFNTNGRWQPSSIGNRRYHLFDFAEFC